MALGAFARHSRADHSGREVETFRRPATPIQRAGHLCQGFQVHLEIAAGGSLFKPGGKFGDLRGGLNVQMVFGTSF
jgi:hypothetical protein